MNTKHHQRIMLLLISITILMLVWQVYETFFNAHSAMGSTKSSAISQSLTPILAHAAVSTSEKRVAANTLENPTQPTQSNAPVLNNSDAVAAATELSELPNTKQSEYLLLVHSYQIAQMHRLIAEEKAAIALAERNTAQAEAETLKYSGITNNEHINYTAGVSNPTVALSTQQRYQLIYVDYQNNHWSAILMKAGQYYEVSNGEKLPDGYVVDEISQASVVLAKGHKRQHLRFTALFDNIG